MSTVMVTDLNVLAVYVSDMAKAEAFYSNHLGFAKAQDLPPDPDGNLIEIAGKP